MSRHAQLGPIASCLPQKQETIDDLRIEFPHWNLDEIYKKTGIHTRHVAGEDECASDLGVRAAERLFAKYGIQRESIDFLLFCSQAPDYVLPTTACLMQERLGMSKRIGALDFNLGCSGFVYGLSLAEGLICSGAASRVLLVTADTYSKYIHPTDRSLRTIFGDGAAATLIENGPGRSLGPFTFGTDGRGGHALMVASGGARPEKDALKPRKRKRWPSRLYMDGSELVSFALSEIPSLVSELFEKAKLHKENIDYYLMHQATRKMLEMLRTHLELPPEKAPIEMESLGNTVSSTLPLLIEEMRKGERIAPGTRSLLLGFGVGLSWSGGVWHETWNETEKKYHLVDTESG
jgi:3-oxoacyl-[acyl-carrier-protein] synthase-3